MVKPDDCVPATVTFIDIAGLVEGAHKGEGLGNQFLAKIREVDAIVHVARAFKNPTVTHPHSSHYPGTKNQIFEDIELVNLELLLGDIINIPTIYVLNTDEDGLKDPKLLKGVEEKYKGKGIAICAKLEEEMIDLDNAEKLEMFKLLDWERSGLDRLVKEAYDLLRLITFYTIKGGKEVHSWSLRRGSSALEAAAEVHTDFAKNFIKAEVIPVKKLLDVGSWKEAKDKGLVKLEGKDYEIRERDVIEFKTGKGH
jgi:hypothetical protein